MILTPKQLEEKHKRCATSMACVAAKEVARWEYPNTLMGFATSDNLPTRSMEGKALVPEFKVGQYVMVRHRPGLAKGQIPFIAIAKVLEIRNYSYQLQWHTEGYTPKDIPGTVTTRFHPHRVLVPVPVNVVVADLRNMLSACNHSKYEPLTATSILGRQHMLA